MQEMTSGWSTRLNLTLHSLNYLIFLKLHVYLLFKSLIVLSLCLK